MVHATLEGEGLVPADLRILTSISEIRTSRPSPRSRATFAVTAEAAGGPAARRCIWSPTPWSGTPWSRRSLASAYTASDFRPTPSAP